MSRFLMVIFIISLIGIAFWQLGHAGLIAAKAWAAPALIEHAFEQTEETTIPVLPWPWADSYPLAKLTIPRLQATRFVLSQSSMRNLAFGPTVEHYGQNKIFYGHRDTHFDFLKDLKQGDQVHYKLVGLDTEIWRVEQTAILSKDDIYVPIGNREPVTLLVTCYPFDSILENTPERFVVWLKPENAVHS